MTTFPTPPVSFVIIGASGDLSTRKIIPALFALFIHGLLPEDFRIFGFCRTPFTDASFREKIAPFLPSRCNGRPHCDDDIRAFLDHCHATTGQYGDTNGYLDLYQHMAGFEADPGTRRRIFYMAVPPNVFLDVARALGRSGLVHCGDQENWSRIVIEKPFGRDRETSDQLVTEMGRVFAENQTYRIDHYLAKELVQNLLVLRFANALLEPVWNAQAIDRVDILWKEDNTLQGRAGYFDAFGIVRDVMQNHLLQILALLALEPPAAYDEHAIRTEKTRVFKAIRPPTLADAAFAQYQGYRGEKGVPPGSHTPTYASVALAIDTPRWRGVPFTMTAGKGMDQSLTEVRVTFKQKTPALFSGAAANQLILRIQPGEAITYMLNVKKPGLSNDIVQLPLDLAYSEHLAGSLPDAYERLLLDILNGDRSLFIRADELAAAWDVFTPLLHAYDTAPEPPLTLYPLGSPTLP